MISLFKLFLKNNFIKSKLIRFVNKYKTKMMRIKKSSNRKLRLKYFLKLLFLTSFFRLCFFVNQKLVNFSISNSFRFLNFFENKSNFGRFKYKYRKKKQLKKRKLYLLKRVNQKLLNSNSSFKPSDFKRKVLPVLLHALLIRKKKNKEKLKNFLIKQQVFNININLKNKLLKEFVFKTPLFSKNFIFLKILKSNSKIVKKKNRYFVNFYGSKFVKFFFNRNFKFKKFYRYLKYFFAKLKLKRQLRFQYKNLKKVYSKSIENLSFYFLDFSFKTRPEVNNLTSSLYYILDESFFEKSKHIFETKFKREYRGKKEDKSLNSKNQLNN
jgi:hypothetical protein